MKSLIKGRGKGRLYDPSLGKIKAQKLHIIETVTRVQQLNAAVRPDIKINDNSILYLY